MHQYQIRWTTGEWGTLVAGGFSVTDDNTLILFDECGKPSSAFQATEWSGISIDNPIALSQEQNQPPQASEPAKK